MSIDKTLAQRLFDSLHAKAELEELLDDADVLYAGIGWDEYDGSLELTGVTADYRPNEKVQRIFYDAGFVKVYVNHIDKWETHYTFDPKRPFSIQVGWRVSYPHKRKDDDKSIWVEKIVPSWPADWFTTGYAVIKKRGEQ